MAPLKFFIKFNFIQYGPQKLQIETLFKRYTLMIMMYEDTYCTVGNC